MLRRVGLASSSSVAVFSSTASTSTSSLLLSVRHENTGAHHSFEPGPITKAIRKAFVMMTPSTWRTLMAQRMEKNLKKVEQLEKENAWMRRHGSPLHVMGLPEHATLAEVKTRYRDLIFETHPDTAQQFQEKQANTATSTEDVSGDANATAIAAPANKNVLPSPAKRVNAQQETDYEILQTAYKMLLNPDSLYHRNNQSPALLEDVYELSMYKGTSKTSQVVMFGWATWVLGGVVGCIIVFVGMRQGWEFMFRLFDPEFYRYMQQREAEEAAQEAAGIEVNRDTKQFAPLSVKKLMYPGRFVHGAEEKVE